jgi:hypothetical protein
MEIGNWEIWKYKGNGVRNFRMKALKCSQVLSKKVLPTSERMSLLNRLIQETKKIKVQNSYKIHT